MSTRSFKRTSPYIYEPWAYHVRLYAHCILPELSIPDTLHRMKLVSHIKGLQTTHAQWLIDDEKRRAKVQASITTF